MCTVKLVDNKFIASREYLLWWNKCCYIQPQQDPFITRISDTRSLLEELQFGLEILHSLGVIGEFQQRFIECFLKLRNLFGGNLKVLISVLYLKLEFTILAAPLASAETATAKFFLKGVSLASFTSSNCVCVCFTIPALVISLAG